MEIDTVPMPQANILSGIEVGPLGLNAVKIITFKAIVSNRDTAFITNKSTVVYTYTDPNTGLETIVTQESNPAITVTLTNTGTITAFNVVYHDILPPSLELVADSVKVNDTLVNDADLVSGINVGTLIVGDSATITYSAKVIGGSCFGYLVNQGYADYYYVLPNKVTGEKTTEICKVSISVNISNLKQIIIDKRLCLPPQKPSIEDVDNVNAEILIDNYYVVETIPGISNEAQQLSKYKLIVHGTIKVSIEYTALVEDQALHSAHCDYPFSAFIVLPIDYNKQNIDVSPILEDVSIDSISCRCADMGIIFLLAAQIK